MSLLQLRAGELRLALRPDLGAAITGLWWAGLPLLRSSDLPQSLTSARQAGALVLAPYSNRIAAGRFQWDGQLHQLALAPGEPHALHGVAWQRPWTVLAQTPDSLQLELRHRPDADWPFAFTLRQRLSLRQAPANPGLDLALELISDHDHDQPGPAWAGIRSSSAATAPGCAWRCSGAGPAVPTGCRWPPSRSRRWMPMWLRWTWTMCSTAGTARRASTMRNSACACAAMRGAWWSMRRPAGPFHCVEPVSHIHNAVNLGDPLAAGLVRLPPGERLTLDCHLDIHPHPS